MAQECDITRPLYASAYSHVVSRGEPGGGNGGHDWSCKKKSASTSQLSAADMAVGGVSGTATAHVDKIQSGCCFQTCPSSLSVTAQRAVTQSQFILYFLCRYYALT